MKKILFVIVLISSFILKAQTLSYTDEAVLFSTDDNYGTARYTGLSGAFGALGGDMTAVDINPAGLAVFNNVEISSTLSYRDSEINTSFYENTINNSEDHVRFSQIGGVYALKIYGNSKFKKIAFGINYNLIKDFDENYIVEGNSGVADFVDDPYLNYDDDETNNIYYENVDNQFFGNFTDGTLDRLSFSFATQYEDILYVGASLNFQHLSFYQHAKYEEENNDGNGNTLRAYTNEYLRTLGSGFNLGIGAIVKPVQNLRLGISYQFPIRFQISERFIEEITILVSNNSQEPYKENYEPNYFDYEIKTSSKLTGSIAYIFGKTGLVSLDYIYQPYKDTKLIPSGEFIDENQEMSNRLRNTSSFKIGTEWRYNILTFRGGYRLIQNPYKNADSSFDLTGYSFGLGVKFTRNLKLDFAFDKSSYSDQYQFLNIDGVEPAKLDHDNNRFTSTLVVNF